MTQAELMDLMVRHGYQCRVKGDEVAVEHCIFCGNPKWNLELNVKRGVFHCWACNSSGTLQGFLKRHLDFVTEIAVNLEDGSWTDDIVAVDPDSIEKLPVLEVPTARQYLEKRGVPLSACIRHKISVCVDKRSKLYGRILLPVREYWAQTFYGYLGRAYLGEVPKYLASFPGKVVSGFRVFSPVHVVVEGLFDGLSVHSAGYNAAVLLGVTDQSIDYWAMRVKPKDAIVILLDGDAKERSEELFWKIKQQHENVVQFNLPGNMDPAQVDPGVMTRLIHTAMERGGIRAGSA